MFVFALSGYILLAVVSVLDKFILSKTAVKPLLFTFYSTIFVLPVLALVPLGVRFLHGPGDWGVAVVSGVAFGLGALAIAYATRESEVSHVQPLIGAITPLAVLFLARVFLGEILSDRQLWGIMILVIGSLVVSFEKSSLHSGWHKGLAWGVASAALFAVSHVTAKYIYDGYGFFSGFIWTRAAIGLVGLALLLVPKLRRELRGAFVGRTHTAGRGGGWGQLLFVTGDKFLGAVAALVLQYAASLGSVSIVNALAGIQFVALVVLVAVVSRFWPRWFKEEYARRELAQEFVGVALIGAGLFFIL